MRDLSLIICTRNRAAQLTRCLTYVAAIETRADWELVLVDNGSSDNTAGVIADFAKSARFPVLNVNEPLRGLGRARNAGLRVARGRLIAFTDDDCYPASDYIQNVSNVFTDTSLGFVGGRVTLYSIDDYPFTIKESLDTQYFPPRSYIAAGQLAGANMVFRREVIDEIGGFDADFGAGTLFCCEDCDAFERASFAGWRRNCGLPRVPEILVRFSGCGTMSMPILPRSACPRRSWWWHVSTGSRAGRG